MEENKNNLENQVETAQETNEVHEEIAHEALPEIPVEQVEPPVLDMAPMSASEFEAAQAPAELPPVPETVATEEVAAEDGFALKLDHYDPQKQEEESWKERTGLNEETLCGAIETIIFMNDKPVPLMKIRNLIDGLLPLRYVHEAIARLQEGYEKAHHGLRLVEVAEGYQFRTKATYAKFVQDVLKVNSLELTPTALEVLAIIAYKQPVAKTEVDKIRGVDSSHIVRALMDKRLVKVAGRSDELGRPTLYGTTNEFLEVFNLPDIEHLPPEHELEAMVGTGFGKISDIRTIAGADDKARFKFDEIEELDKLTETIKQIAADTAFTRSLEVETKKRFTENGEGVKSAFDLLEEFIANKAISDENKKAILSELVNAAVSPRVIENLEEGPFNIPDMTDEDEDFVMIDLDTGLPIVNESVQEESQEILLHAPKDENAPSMEDQLAMDVDQSHVEQVREKLESEVIEEVVVEKIETKSEEIDEITEEMVNKANELDIDLSFMQVKNEEFWNGENLH